MLEDTHFLPAITDEVSLEYLIPTKSGAGALTTALVDFLIKTHNDFVNMCCEKVEETTKRYMIVNLNFRWYITIQRISIVWVIYMYRNLANIHCYFENMFVYCNQY